MNVTRVYNSPCAGLQADPTSLVTDVSQEVTYLPFFCGVNLRFVVDHLATVTISAPHVGF